MNYPVRRILSGVAGPRFLTRLVWHTRIEPTRRLYIALRLLAADLRCEIAKQRELLHHSEIMRRRLGCDCSSGSIRCLGSLLPLVSELILGFLLLLSRLVSRVGLRLLLCVERLEKSEALLWCRRHERSAVNLSTLSVQRLHALAKFFLILGLVAVRDDDRHECACLRRLCARRAGLGKNRIRNFVEERNFLGRERCESFL